MADTPRLDLPYLSASQAQKEIMHNIGLDRLDLLVQCAALDRNLSAPPGAPAPGALYIVGPAPTGAWAGHADELAIYNNAQWLFILPLVGFQCWLIDEAILAVWDGAAWITVQNALTFLGLSDTPASYSGQAGKAVLVNAGASALEFGDPPAGATTFLALTDTPDTYSGAATQFVRINAGATALEFAAGTAGTFLALSDTPDTYSGHNGKVVSVKSDATGLEFIAGGGGGGSVGLHRGALVELGTDQTLPNTTPTILAWGSAVYDTNSIWASGQPTRLVVPAGVSRFMVQAQVEFAGAIGGYRSLNLLKNGSPVPSGQGTTQVPVDTADLVAPNTILSVSTPVLAVSGGDYFELEITQNSGVPLTAIAGNQTWAAAVVISDIELSGSTFLALSDTPDSYSGQAGKAVVVNAGATALEFATAGGGGYTDEQAQDAVGAMLVDSATIDLTYTDATPALTASVIDASITEAKLGFSDVTTKDASITAHGLLRKLSGTATEYLDGTGAWTTPAGGGGSQWTRVPAVASTLTTGLLAFWRMEETSGNRLDSVSGLALVPNGGATSGVGKHGNGAKFAGVSGSYLSIADNATLSIGSAQSFTIACWVCFDATPVNNSCIVGKGNTASSYAGAEYMLWIDTGTVRFFVSNGTSNTAVNSAFTPVVGEWFFVVGWFDVTGTMLNIQINNAAPISLAAIGGHSSYDSTFSMEVGRTPNWSGAPIINARVDNVMFYKRVLNSTERTSLWNSGSGRDYADLGGTPAYLHPTTSTDIVLAGSTTPTAIEPLESSGGLKLGTSTSTTDGVLRWNGTDLEVRKGGAWTSLTIDTLLASTDFPDAYTGNALKLLRVNAAANAVEFGDVLGTMATQNANAVAITGGTADGLTFCRLAGSLVAMYANGMAVYDAAGNDRVSFYSGVNTAGGTGRYAFWGGGTAPSYFGGTVQVTSKVHIGTSPYGFSTKLEVYYDKTAQWGASFLPNGDSGPYGPAIFMNGTGVQVGSIAVTASATAYNTSSDIRLKHAIAPLTAALERVRALRPVSFKWNSTDESDEGFLAHELQQVAPRAVTGQPDEVNADGSIRPQQTDASKLVPLLTAGLQAALAQIDALTARISTLEQALGA